MKPALPTRLRWRMVAAVTAATVIASTVTGIALARGSAPRIGNGVVVIETALGYQGGAAAGTGMVLTPSGEILTNNHVIRGATTIRIVIPGTSRSYRAKVVGYDVADDVAVVQAVGASNLRTITTASKVSVGDAVTAVGNAGGTGALTSATGSVTGLAQAITVSDDQGGAARLTGLIETNANVLPGDSGGPLYNRAGQVVGMDTAGSAAYVSRSSGASDAYAIPIAKALSIVKQIESGKSSARVHVGATPFLGIEIQTVRRFSTGALIVGVAPGGPAASAGLAPGDVITAIDGRAVSSPATIPSLLLAKKPGATVTIAYADSYGSSHSARVKLGSGPAQ